MLSFFLLAFVFIMAMLPQNILQMYTIIQNFGRIGLIITIAYPSVLLVIALLRKKRGGLR
jgi:spore germination protein